MISFNLDYKYECSLTENKMVRVVLCDVDVLKTVTSILLH